MSENTVTWPTQLGRGKIIGRLVYQDAHSQDTNVKAKPVQGVVRLTPSAPILAAKPITGVGREFTARLNSDGVLVGDDDAPGVEVATDGKSTWRVEVIPSTGYPETAAWHVIVPKGGTVDIATADAVAAQPGTVVQVLATPQSVEGVQTALANIEALRTQLEAFIAGSQVSAPNLQRHFYEKQVYVPSENIWLFGDREAPPSAVSWGTSWASAQGTWDETEKAWRLPAGSIRLTQMNHYAPMPVLPGQAYKVELDIKPDRAGQRAHFAVYDVDGGSKVLLSLHDMAAGWNSFEFDYTTQASALDRFTLFFQHATGSADGGAWFRIRVRSLGRAEYDTPAINTAAGSGYKQYGNFPLRLWRDGNLVQLTGPLVTTEDYVNGATLTVLPEWARPDEAEYLNVYRSGQAIILPDGQVQLHGLNKPSAGIRLGRLIWRVP